MVARYSYLSHLRCSACQRRYEADRLQTTSPCCSRPLLAQYDLSAIERDVARDEIARREASMWRYHELLPVREKAHVQTLGEGMTPLVAASRLAPPGLEKDARLLAKDEGQNPTGRFKARGMAVAGAPAMVGGGGGIVAPTRGNEGGTSDGNSLRGRVSAR